MPLSTEEEIELLELEIAIAEEQTGGEADPGTEFLSEQQIQPEQFAAGLAEGIGEATKGKDLSFEGVKPDSQLDKEAEIAFRGERRQFPEEPLPVPERLLKRDEQGVAIPEKRTGLSFGEKTADVLLTEDRSPIGFLSLPARTLGAALSKGSISKEDTKLFKGTIKDLNEWASDRDNQNKTADSMIQNLQSALDSMENMSPQTIQEFQSQIDVIEESKNSGALTTATQVLGNFSLEAGSDPLVLLDFANALKGVLFSGGKATIEGLKSGIKGVRAAEKQAIKDVARKRLKTTSPQKLEDIVEAGGGKQVVSRLEKEGVGISEGELVVPEGKFSEQIGKIRTQGRLEDEAAEASLLAREQGEISEATSQFKGETSAIREKARGATEGAPAKIDLTEGRSIDDSEIQNSIENFRRSLTEDRQPIKQLDLVRDVRRKTSLPPENRAEIIRDILKSNSGEFKELDDTVASLTKGKHSKREIRSILKGAGFGRGIDDLGDAVLFLNQGDLESASKVIDRMDELLVASIKTSSKQKTVEAAAPARAIKTKLTDMVDNVLKENMGDEMFKEFEEIADTGAKTFGAEKSALKTFQIDPEQIGKLEFGGKTDAVKAMKKSIDAEAKEFFENGLKQTDAMNRGKWPQWKKFLGKDFLKDIRLKGAKLAEAEVKKAISSGKITDEIASQAKSVDAILNTNLSNKIGSISGRSAKAKAATAERLPVKRLTKNFEGRVDGIKKSFAKQLSKSEKSKKSKIQSILKIGGDPVLDSKAMVAKLKSRFLDAVEDVSKGQKSTLSIQDMREIDKVLGTNYEKLAKDVGRASGFNLDILGKIRKTPTGGELPTVSVSVAGAVGGPAAVKVAGASQIAKKIAVSIKKKQAEKAIKEVFKIKKASRGRKEELAAALRDVRAGKNVLERELGKGDIIKNLDVLISKGILPAKAITSILDDDEIQSIIDQSQKSSDTKIKRAGIRLRNELDRPDGDFEVDETIDSPNAKEAATGKGLGAKTSGAIKILRSAQGETIKGIKRAISMLESVKDEDVDFDTAQGNLTSARIKLKSAERINAR